MDAVRLIVNADDFGWSPEVNRGIVEGHARGLISSTTAIVNAPGFEEAAALAHDMPTLGVGLHINLTQGRPVSSPSSVPSLVTSAGTFVGAATIMRRLLLGRIPASQFNREIRAQLARFREYIGEPTHLDVHKHIQAFGILPSVFAELAECLDPPRIRCVREFPRWVALDRLPETSKAAVLWMASHRIRRILLRAGYRMPDRTLGILDTGHLTGPTCRRLLERLRTGTTELMCHPSATPSQSASPAFTTRLMASRVEELKAVMDPSLREVLESRGIELVSYTAL